MVSALVLMTLAAGASPDAGSSGTFRVLTYNIHHGEGSDGKVDLERIADIIRAARADIVCLQEVDRNVGRSKHVDTPEFLARRLGMHVAYGPNLDLDGGHYGNATLTRFPIRFEENIPLPTPEGDEPRGCLRTTLDINGRAVDVYNTHFGLSADQRKEQAAAVATRLDDDPVIVAGDLNDAPDGPAVAILLTKLRDALRTGLPETGRIDYVLVSRDIDVLSSRLVSTPAAKVASDHPPYAADMSLGAPPRGAGAKGIYDTDDTRVDEAVGED